MVCDGAADCLLVCTGANNCAFSSCSGSGAVSCADDVLVCHRECPSCGDGVCDQLLELPGDCEEDCG
jgi:hypothetical protein